MLVTTQCASYCRYCTRSRIVGDASQNFNTQGLRGAARLPASHAPGPRRAALRRRPADHVARSCSSGSCAACARSRTSRSSASARACRCSCPSASTTSSARCSRSTTRCGSTSTSTTPTRSRPEVSRAVDKLSRTGIPIGNQSVLLAGVNDCVHIQRDLVHKLVENRIRPYYLYQCDLVEGSGHFRTPVGKGLEIIEGLRGHTTGYAVPDLRGRRARRRRQDPGHAQLPHQLLRPQGRAAQLRGLHHDLRGADRRTRPTTGAACSYCRNERSEPGQGGVHGLLQGDAMWIEPAGHDEIHARGNTEAHRLQAPEKWVPYGVGAIEGQAGAAAGQLRCRRRRGRRRTAPARSRDRARVSPPARPTASCSSAWASSSGSSAAVTVTAVAAPAGQPADDAEWRQSAEATFEAHADKHRVTRVAAALRPRLRDDARAAEGLRPREQAHAGARRGRRRRARHQLARAGLHGHAPGGRRTPTPSWPSSCRCWPTRPKAATWPCGVVPPAPARIASRSASAPTRPERRDA